MTPTVRIAVARSCAAVECAALDFAESVDQLRKASIEGMTAMRRLDAALLCVALDIVERDPSFDARDVTSGQ